MPCKERTVDCFRSERQRANLLSKRHLAEPLKMQSRARTPVLGLASRTDYLGRDGSDLLERGGLLLRQRRGVCRGLCECSHQCVVLRRLLQVKTRLPSRDELAHPATLRRYPEMGPKRAQRREADVKATWESWKRLRRNVALPCFRTRRGRVLRNSSTVSARTDFASPTASSSRGGRWGAGAVPLSSITRVSPASVCPDFGRGRAEGGSRRRGSRRDAELDQASFF